MLTEAIIQTSTPTSLKITDVDQDELLILESISGLSSVKTNLYLGEFAREGGYYQGRRTEKRNPVFNFRLQPNYAEDIEASDIREMLYRMFMEPQRGSDAVQVLLKDDRKPDRYFRAYTETFECDIFTKELRAQVGLLTTDNFLRSAEEVSGSSAEGVFNLQLPYTGSVDTGMNVTVKVLSATSRITLEGPEELMAIEGPFAVNDIITLKTTEGERSIQVNGEDDFGAMTAASRWLLLKPGDNDITISGTVTGDGKAAITAWSYRAAWWGI
jgi:ribosomal protein S28E/S33